MAQTHTFFATAADTNLIVSWLRDAGAVGLRTPLPQGDCPTDGSEFILHFPTIGPVEFWPDDIRLSDYPESSPRWRQAVITTVQQREHPGVRQLDSDRSALAGFRVPEFRDGQHWVSGCVWFPGSRLRDTFPDLARICQRFERWIRGFPTVFNNTKGHDTSPFAYQLCMSGVMQQVVALSEAHALLERGAFMIDHMASPKVYADFRRRLQLSGHVA
jgi:hypothetical protein